MANDREEYYNNRSSEQAHEDVKQAAIKWDMLFQVEYRCPHITPCQECRTKYPHSTCTLNLDAHDNHCGERYNLWGYV